MTKLKQVDLINYRSAKLRVIFPIIMIEFVLVTRFVIFFYSKFYLDEFESKKDYWSGNFFI